MTRLVRLFPRPWRDRYGAEFEALLEETPLTVRTLGDIVGAAASARLGWLFGPLEERLDRLAAGRLASAAAQRVGATTGVVGGSLWALTFAVGSAVDWGRWGNDLGFLLLIAAAGLLFVAQVTTAVITTSPARVIDWLGVGISSLGAAVLVVAFVAAIVLERPLAVRFGWSPLQYWEAGMLGIIVGASISALAGSTDGRLRWLSTWVITGSTITLGLALLLSFDGPILVSSNQRFEGQHGWFVTNLAVSAAGIFYGIGLMAAALDRLGAVRHRKQRHPLPKIGGD